MGASGKWAVLAGLPLATLVLAAIPAAAATAASGSGAPSRTGWWSTLSAAGTALPAPTTAAGNLHVGADPNGPTAFAAVAYPPPQPQADSATLTLKIVTQNTVGTPALRVCPITTASWPAGGNQPYSAAPTYSCTHAVPGVLGTGGASVTFSLDTAEQDPTGGYDLAVVGTDGAAPFSLDLSAPGVGSLSPMPAASTLAPGSTPAADSAATGTAGTAGTTSGSGPAGPTIGSGPPLPSGAMPAALPPGGVTNSGAVQPPQVAAAGGAGSGAGPAGATGAASPQLAAAGLPRPVDREFRAALVLLVLLGTGLALVAAQPSRAPRLIGGPARAGANRERRVGADAGAIPLGAGQGGAPRGTGARGLGRFSRPRTEPPAPLR